METANRVFLNMGASTKSSARKVKMAPCSIGVSVNAPSGAEVSGGDPPRVGRPAKMPPRDAPWRAGVPPPRGGAPGLRGGLPRHSRGAAPGLSVVAFVPSDLPRSSSLPREALPPKAAAGGGGRVNLPVMRIGIDVGGTKVEGLVLAASGHELARQRVATPRDDYRALLDVLASMVAALETAATGRASVGIGTPGVRSPATGVIVNSNLGVLNGRDVAADVAARLRRPVRVENDANCFVLSEASDGAAAPETPVGPETLDLVFGATLGTGVGGGIVVNGRVLAGLHGAAAEWSHTTLPFLKPGEEGRPGCFCGRVACIESFISGPALEHDHAQATGRALPGKAVVALAESGDAQAAACVARYEDRLARALAGVINLLDPRVIVLGGGLSDIPSLYRNVLPITEQYTVVRKLETKLVRARHGDASGARGAAWLWPEAASP